MTSGPPPRPTGMQAKNLASLYDLDTLDWAPVAGALEAGVTQAPGTGGPDRHTFWLATVDADGRPHVSGVGAAWRHGCLWFTTSATSRKARNLAGEPRCTVSVTMPDHDLVLEGVAEQVRDPERVAEHAAEAAAGGWPAEPTEDGTAVTAPYSAPSAGPPPWHLYRVTPTHATVLHVREPGGATRFTF